MHKCPQVDMHGSLAVFLYSSRGEGDFVWKLNPVFLLNL